MPHAYTSATQALERELEAQAAAVGKAMGAAGKQIQAWEIAFMFEMPV
jgi:hypothetical protein